MYGSLDEEPVLDHVIWGFHYSKGHFTGALLNVQGFMTVFKIEPFNQLLRILFRASLLI